ncbi:4Fe-4S binding protein [Endozoicomonas arenosclerae]|uniref:4Fe-4S binding protein n=1 Tax=Endozoicomonas arenosclerae TaxID=1633495 RepID=UPI000786026D|nr:4Fe-4S binding protein [Endozoicomonas arenosclerae]
MSDKQIQAQSLMNKEQLQSPSRRAFFRRFAGPAEVELPVSEFPRPPWAMGNNEFLALCNRCNRCIDVCPRRVLRQSDESSSFLQGLPTLSLEYGSCDFCGLCVEACPTGALSRESGEKRQALALVSDHCQLTYNQSCDFCIDACEEGAIKLSASNRIEIDPNGCTGCGECSLDCYNKAISLVKRQV